MVWPAIVLFLRVLPADWKCCLVLGFYWIKIWMKIDIGLVETLKKLSYPRISRVIFKEKITNNFTIKIILLLKSTTSLNDNRKNNWLVKEDIWYNKILQCKLFFSQNWLQICITNKHYSYKQKQLNCLSKYIFDFV